MKKIYALAALAALTVTGISCNDEFVEEQYEHYISFRSPLDEKGVTNIYVPYTRTDMLGNPTEGGEGQSSYRLPMIVSGSLENQQDITVHIAHDPDTLDILNEARYATRTDLYYEDMGADGLTYVSWPETVQFTPGEDVTLCDLKFDFRNIDMSDKWVLPLTIVDSPEYGYTSHPRKNYAKALLRVLPFNDYSGTYSTTTMQVFIKNEDGSYNQEDAIVESTRTAYVVDDNTVFFYAGLMDEELIDRRNYKVYFKFDPENHYLSLSTDNENIKLTPANNNMFAFTVSEQMDATYPYLMHRYVIFNIEYDFVDYTSAPGVEIPYKVKGTMTMERQINTQIPDEDQAIQW